MYDSLKNKTALYIEDDVDVLSNIATLLGNFFKTLYTAVDGEEGLKIFFNEDIDVLLVDIELPKLSGIDFIKKVRLVDEHIPIAIISAYTKTDYLLESVELKLDKYIVKPFTSKKMYMLLESFDADFKSQEIKELTTGVFINSCESIISFEGTSHLLTLKELVFLEVLVAKKFISYDEIDAIWEETAPTADAIRSFIKTLRKKLPEGILKNRQNLGYFLESNCDVK